MRTVHLRLTRYEVPRDCVRPRVLHRTWLCTHCAAAAIWRHAWHCKSVPPSRMPVCVCACAETPSRAR
jgi:hypothetical protein